MNGVKGIDSPLTCVTAIMVICILQFKDPVQPSELHINPGKAIIVAIIAIVSQIFGICSISLLLVLSAHYMRILHSIICTFFFARPLIASSSFAVTTIPFTDLCSSKSLTISSYSE